jgi:hypothetical protein
VWFNGWRSGCLMTYGYIATDLILGKHQVFNFLGYLLLFSHIFLFFTSFLYVTEDVFAVPCTSVVYVYSFV